jgi:hypothetical protein
MWANTRDDGQWSWSNRTVCMSLAAVDSLIAESPHHCIGLHV